MKLLLASQNHHKRVELAAIFHEHEIMLPEEIGVEFEYEETGSTYLENAFGKAMHLFQKTRIPIIADDSGLSVPALGGEPGVFSARYGSENGILLSAESRNRLLLSRMASVVQRQAFFVCCMVLILEEYRFFIAQETLHGEISREPSGAGGFGYDPVFYLPDYGCTVAELPSVTKNSISHRGRASTVILRYLD